MKRGLGELVGRLQRGIHAQRPRRADWSGVYASMAEVPASGPGFSSDLWIELTRMLTEGALAATRSSFIAVGTRSDSQLLAALVAATPAGAPVRILDFGGGMGIGFVHLDHALANGREVDYHVVEGPRVCEAGARLLREHRSVQFRPTLPEATSPYDIVYACSSLQYIDDHRGLLASFASLAPRHILLADVPAGDVATFWTAQLTIAGSRIPYKFFNARELVDSLSALGYRLQVRGVAERGLRVESLPPQHRIERTCNLLFAR